MYFSEFQRIILNSGIGLRNSGEGVTINMFDFFVWPLVLYRTLGLWCRVLYFMTVISVLVPGGKAAWK